MRKIARMLQRQQKLSVFHPPNARRILRGENPFERPSYARVYPPLKTRRYRYRGLGKLRRQGGHR